jgi:hypothetical protein
VFVALISGQLGWSCHSDDYAGPQGPLNVLITQ